MQAKQYLHLTMLLDNNSSKKTHYDILGVRENATYEEIRASYRSSLLETHPDKSHNSSATSSLIQNPENKFIDVQKAWEILGDSKSRFTYDCELQAIRNDFVAAEDVCLEDLTVEIDGESLELFHQCRCGDYYSIGSSELEEMGYKLLNDENKISVFTTNDLSASVLIPCGSCSLQLCVLINSEFKRDTKF